MARGHESAFGAGRFTGLRLSQDIALPGPRPAGVAGRRWGQFVEGGAGHASFRC